MTKDKALDLALEALEHMLEDAKQERLTVEYWNECVDAITAIKQARSAPVQPVAFNAGVPPLYPEMKDGETISVEYTTPPAAQRQWVGLTDEEFRSIVNNAARGGMWAPKPTNVAVAAVHAASTKLKEKNT